MDSSLFEPFEYQVAGHDAKNVSGNIGILRYKGEGYILKPINKSPQGDVEIKFYDRVESDESLSSIKEFIPQYGGFLYLNLNNKDIRFLKLRDVTFGFSKPCVIDIKIGKQTWDPSASLQKRTTEDAKYVECKREFGFCIPGYAVFNIEKGQLEKIGKNEGKNLDKETTINAFRHFFNISSPSSDLVVKHVIQRLETLLSWWETQTIVHIYSSSVLITYDAQQLQDLIGKKVESKNIEQWVKVYMIDFAHVFPANQSKDCNYISGLTKLIEVLKKLIN